LDAGTFGRFRDLLPLGEGGMGQVFLARAVGPGGFVKPVVLKRMHVALAKVPELVERFLREARIQASLMSPNIVQVLDFGRMDDTYFLVLEYVHGVDLGVLLRTSEAPLPIGVAVRIALDVCRGLEYAHRARDASGAPLALVHRDVSPANVLVSYEGDAKVGDFGLVQSSTGDAARGGVIYGKPAYLSPEQARGEGVDVRGDLFSLGTVLYFELTGIEPFRAGTRAETMSKVLAAAPEPVEAVRSDVPPALAAIVGRAMQPRPEDRFSDAAEMLSALESVAHELGAAASSRAVREHVRALCPGAADRDPWSADARFQALELRRLVAEDGVTVLTAAESGKPAPPSARARWPWIAATGLAGAIVLFAAVIASSGGPADEATRAPRDAEERTSPPEALGAKAPPASEPRPAPDPRTNVPAAPSGGPEAAPPAGHGPRPPSGRRATPGPVPTEPPTSAAAGETAAPIVEPRRTGRLRVGATPGWGWVSVDGRRVGTTPLDVEVEAGSRVVRVVGGRSGREHEQSVRVDEGATRSLFLESFE
jgi:serine/threonine-protein kinase